jgi:DNA-binding transcriptional LysR family regulator
VRAHQFEKLVTPAGTDSASEMIADPLGRMFGETVRPVDVSMRMPNTYWIVSPKAIARTPKISTFRQWLLAEAEEDARRVNSLYSR